jgi:capsular exopolysaccharide synthesis family protein
MPRFAIKELAFNNLYEIARRRWKTLMAFQALMITLALAYCFVGSQKYESSAQILVMLKDSNKVTSPTHEGGDAAKVQDDTLATQLQVLHSDKIINAALGKIVDKGKLEEIKQKYKQVEKQTSTNLYYLSMRTIGVLPSAPEGTTLDAELLEFKPIDISDVFADSDQAAILGATTGETSTETTAPSTDAAATTPESKPASPAATADASQPPAKAADAPVDPAPAAPAAPETTIAGPLPAPGIEGALPTPGLEGSTPGAEGSSALLNNDWLIIGELPGIKENLDTNEKVANYVKDRLVLSRGGSGQERESHIINIEFRHPDPVESKLVLDAVLDAYKRFLDEKFSDVNQEAAKLIEKASNELEINAAAAIRDYQLFRERSPVVFANEGSTNIPQVRWEAIQKDLLAVQLLLKDARSRVSIVEPQLVKLKQSGMLSHHRLLAMIDEKNSTRIINIVTASQSEAKTAEFLRKQVERQQLVQTENDKLLNLTGQMTSMKVELGPKHPDVLKLQEEINHIKAYVEKLREELKGSDEPVMGPEELMDAYVDLLRTDVLTLEQREQDLLESASREEEESKGLIRYELEGLALREQARRAEQLHQAVLERLGQINLAKDYTGFINETMQAPEYGAEVWPNVPILLALAVAMGLVLGAGTCGAQEYFDRSFRDPDEVRRDLDLPLLTHVPDLHRKRAEVAAGSRVHYSICSFHKPKSRESEVFRGLRTSLFFSGEGAGCSVIMSTSPNKGDGKSTMITNLAVSIAQAGYKVLLIDCDMRRPSSHKLLGLSNALGLSDLLGGNKKPGEVIQSTETENLSVITSGPCPSNPAELLTSPGFESFLKTAREKYRFVLLDCPPVLAVADPCIIAPRADGVVMVIRVAQDSRPQALRAKEMLQRVNGRILGVVVNASDESTKNGYGSTGDSTFAYGYDYGNGRSSRNNNGYYDDRNGEEEDVVPASVKRD